jgi:hypothetical protein
MKCIEIRCKRLFLPTKVYLYWAWTIQDALDLFKEQHPNEKVSFAHDLEYSLITKQFQNEAEVQRG